MNHHLTPEQLNDLLLAPGVIPPNTQVERHLRACSVCSDELLALRASLASFRSAATSFAHQQSTLAPRAAAPAPSSRLLTFRGPLSWAAAAAIVVAAVLPASMRYIRPKPSPAPVTVAPHTQLSDEALLEEINQNLSAPVPSAMQPLNDPTGSLSNSTNTQRTSK